MENFVLEDHFESHITLVKHHLHGLVVQKRYRQEHPCVAWLNTVLKPYYPDDRFLPIAQHEARALLLLSQYGISPKLIEYSFDSVVMEFAGTPITKDSSILIKNYEKLASRIINLFVEIGFKHNDLLPRNVLLHDGVIKLIDFTLSEFNDIKFMALLPNSKWARYGEDYNLLNYGKLYLV